MGPCILVKPLGRPKQLVPPAGSADGTSMVVQQQYE